MCSALALGNTLRSITTAELVSEADVVAVVQIQSRHFVEFCGTSYLARVLHRVKGLSPDVDEITFGPYLGRHPGNTYLVFLTRSPRRVAVFDGMTVPLISELEPESECSGA